MKIGIDLDDVVIDHIPHLVKYYNKEFNDDLKADVVTTWQVVNHLPAFNGCEKTFYEMWDRFYATEDFVNLPPIPDALKSIGELNKRHKIYFITARNPSLSSSTYDWMIRHNLIQYPIYFYKNKGYLGKKLGLDIHIDDGTHNIESVVNEGITGLLYSQPWNQDSKFTKFKNWNDLIDEISIIELEKIRGNKYDRQFSY